MEQEVDINGASIKKDITINRRSFFGVLLGIGAAGMGAILSVPVLRYVLYPLYSKTGSSKWSEVGDVGIFANSKKPLLKNITITQRDGWRQVTSAQAVFVSQAANGNLEVLSAICPHMGCTVAWQAAQDKFVCPCHGGEFKADGQHISGPPPRGLDRLPTQQKDGKLQVQFEYFRSNVRNQEKLS